MCQQGAFTPIGNPEAKEPAVPSQSQIHKRKIPQRVPSKRRGILWGVFAIFMKSWEFVYYVLLWDTQYCFLREFLKKAHIVLLAESTKRGRSQHVNVSNTPIFADNVAKIYQFYMFLQHLKLNLHRLIV